MRQVFKGAAEQGQVVWFGEVASKDGAGRELLKVLGKDLATRAAPLAVFDLVEKALKVDVSAFDQADAPACRALEGDRVAPEGRAMAFEVLEDQVNATASKVGWAA